MSDTHSDDWDSKRVLCVAALDHLSGFVCLKRLWQTGAFFDLSSKDFYSMGTFNEFVQNFFAIMRTFQFKDAVDIIAIGLIIYYLIKLVKETRAVQLVKGIFILLVLYGVAYIFKLTMMTAMLNRFFEFAGLVLFIVFQPEFTRSCASYSDGG